MQWECAPKQKGCDVDSWDFSSPVSKLAVLSTAAAIPDPEASTVNTKSEHFIASIVVWTTLLLSIPFPKVSLQR